MRRSSVALALGLLLALASVTTALAAPPTHEKVKIDETFSEELCGIEVTTHLEINGNALFFPDGHLLDLSLVRITWTNDDGDWLTNFIAGPFSVTETLDGDILTVTATNIGVHELLRSADGISAAFDRGRIIFVTVIDLNDLENPDDDVELSFETAFQAGPHPEADADFALFCEVVTDALG